MTAMQLAVTLMGCSPVLAVRDMLVMASAVPVSCNATNTTNCLLMCGL